MVSFLTDLCCQVDKRKIHRCTCWPGCREMSKVAILLPVTASTPGNGLPWLELWLWPFKVLFSPVWASELSFSLCCNPACTASMSRNLSTHAQACPARSLLEVLLCVSMPGETWLSLETAFNFRLFCVCSLASPSPCCVLHFFPF